MLTLVQTDSDEELVARVLARSDQAAFGEIVARYQGPVRALLRRLAGHPALADDLAQDCFLRAWDKLDGWSGKGSLKSWLMKIAYTRFLQHTRNRKREAEIHAAVPGSRAEDWSGAATPPERPAAAGEAEAELDRLLAVLDEGERSLMLLSYAQGMSHSEISAITDQPIGTIKSSIHRAKQKIRAAFDIPEARHGS